jgi:hypothetical protein
MPLISKMLTFLEQLTNGRWILKIAFLDLFSIDCFKEATVADHLELSNASYQ